MLRGTNLDRFAIQIARAVCLETEIQVCITGIDTGKGVALRSGHPQGVGREVAGLVDHNIHGVVEGGILLAVKLDIAHLNVADSLAASDAYVLLLQMSGCSAQERHR